MSEVKSKNNQQENNQLSKYPELNDSELEIVCGGSPKCTYDYYGNCTFQDV